MSLIDTYLENKKKQKDALISLLPTLGGIGGGVVGSIAGPVGAVAAGGAGAGGGEALKQLLSGQRINPKDIRNQTAFGMAGEAIGIPTGAIMGKVGKGIGERVMGSVFREPGKLAKAAVGKGMTLGQEALEKGEMGTAGSIFKNATQKVSEFEDALQTVLSGVKGKIKISNIEKEIEPSLVSLEKSGNETVPNMIRNRFSVIKQKAGKAISALDAQEIKRTLYDELRKSYGAQAMPGKEELKSVARGFRKAIEDVDKTGAVKGINENLRYYGKIADKMQENIANSQGKPLLDIPNLLGLVGVIPSGGYSLAIPAVAAASRSVVGRTAGANLANILGKSAANPVGQSVIGQGVGQMGNLLQSILVPPTTNTTNQVQNETTYANDPSHMASIIQQGTTPETQGQMPQDGQISPKGQWKFDAKVGDWVPNKEQKQTSLMDADTLRQLAAFDLEKTGGKNLSKIQEMIKISTPTSGGKGLTASAVKGLSDFDTSTVLLSSLNSLVDSNKQYFGPFRGVSTKINKYDSVGQGIQSKIKGVAQIVGKAMEGGVLRKEDVPKYEAMLPNVTDTPESAKVKIKNVIEMLQIQKQMTQQGYEQAGYSAGGSMDAVTAALQELQ